MGRRVVALVCALVAALTLPAAPASATVLDEVAADANWIHSNRSLEGPITVGYPYNKVVPYQANFAAMGLARAAKLTGNRTFSDTAWKWLQWYSAKAQLNDSRDPNRGSGIVYDYERVNGSWTTRYELDSSDSYAGTFLMAVRETFLATGDIQRLRNIVGGIRKALDAIEYTEDKAAGDGLHFAKPGWPFKYTMDEAETYDGLLAATDLGLYLGDNSLRSRAQGMAERLLHGAGSLLDNTTGLFLWARHQDGTAVPAPLDWLYPGGSVQTWAVAHGLATGELADTLMNRFVEAQPNWDRPAAMAQYYNGVRRVDYWPHVALGFIRAGHIDRACLGVRNIRTAAIAAGRAYPFTPGHAGQIIVAMTEPDVLTRSLTGC